MQSEEKYSIIRMIPEHIKAIVSIEKEIQYEPWTESLFLAELRQPQALCFTLTVRGSIAGYVCSNIIHGELHVNNIGIAPSFQNRGYGTGLMVKLLEEARERGARIVHLEVRESNFSALHLYRKLGFRVRGRRPGYYSTPSGKEDAILMSLTL
ncbi:ribosomal protein S18-alanine N-acetyltransferase [Thermodesulforhabdus norvegica]|uniref:[Ribosomal protein bS18]-alanine N-acetyltransferase n=1 Tax=Thermodesulforhabdus norvegica TaxID=39841 RepID=A0A1I4VJT7_9BACT|nr:ribosomal protein S18-alanine N-acetyltransferase [Thermodesulforhabdus norvegica]SFN01306.1 ribosomal-protein-alanine N-acetyltransferase [Thermodesulforhabdus norvegica]